MDKNMKTRRPPWRAGAALTPGGGVLVLVTLALLFTSAQACRSVAPPERAAEGVVITGTVLGAGGQPLAGASVSLAPVMDDHGGYTFRLDPGRIWAEPVVVVTTGAEGRFALPAAPARRWRVLVEHPERAPRTRRLEPLFADRELEPVELPPGRTVEVEVVGVDGLPIAGAAVMGYSVATVAEEPWPSSWSAASTDAAGKARMTVEDTGSWRFEVGAEGRPPVSMSHDDAGPARVRMGGAAEVELSLRLASGEPAAGAVVYRPGRGIPLGVADREGRVSVFGRRGGRLPLAARTAAGDAVESLVRFPAGEGARGQLTLELEPPTRVAVKVTSAASGEPVAGTVAWGSDDRVVRGDDQGRFELVVPGTTDNASLGVAAPGHRPSTDDLPPFDLLRETGLAVALEPAAGLRGRVVDEGGAPLAGVGVQVRVAAGDFSSRRGGSGPWLARTGDDGHFAFAALPAGARLDLVARRPGFAPGAEGVVPLDPFEERGGVEVVLRQGRTVAGRVVSEGGRPVAGAAVEILRGDPAPLDTAEATAVTGADGGFEVRDLAPGRVQLRVSAEGYVPTRWPAVELGAEEVGAADQAGPADEPASARLDLGDLPMEPGQRIAGRVVDGEGRPLPDAVVDVKALEDVQFEGGPPRERTAADGSFAFAGLPPGAYQLRAQLDGLRVAYSQPLQTPLAEPVELVLTRGGTLSGRVVDGSGEAVPGARVSALSGSAGFPAVTGRTDDRGRFRLAGLESVRYSLHVDAEGFQNHEPLSFLVPVSSGEALEVVLHRGAKLEGRVVWADGGPVDDARLTVTPASGGGDNRNGYTGPDGVFSVEGLALGPMVVTARLGSVEVSQEVDLGLGRNRVSFVLPPGLSVSGRVVDGAGRPVASAQVVLGSGRGALGAWTGDDGRFALSDVAPGKHRLSVRHPDYAEHRAEDQLVLEDRPLTGVEVRLSRGASVSGRVVSGTVPGSLPGLSPVDLAAARVLLKGSAGSHSATLDHRGRFRVEHVAPGKYGATVDLGGEVARTTFEVPEGASTVAVELQPVAGVELRGRVVRGGAGVAHVRVSLDTGDGRSLSTDTAVDGGFVLYRVPRGTRDLVVRDTVGDLHRRQVVVEEGEPVTVELHAGGVRGRVVDGASGEPVSRPIVYLEHLPAETSADPLWETWSRRVARRVTGDSRGAFVIPAVESGHYRLRSERKGVGLALRSVEVGGEEVDLELALRQVEAPRLRLSVNGGAPPSDAIYALFDSAGRLEDRGLAEVDSAGEARLDPVPPGAWHLWVRSDRSAWVDLPLSVPADGSSPAPLAVSLDPAATLFATLPELGDDIEEATVVLRDAEGRAPALLQPTLQLHPLASFPMDPVEPFQPGWRVDHLRPGDWTLEATHPDGRSWRATFTARPGEMAEVELR